MEPRSAGPGSEGFSGALDIHHNQNSALNRKLLETRLLGRRTPPSLRAVGQTLTLTMTARSESAVRAATVFVPTDRHTAPLEARLGVLWLLHVPVVGPKISKVFQFPIFRHPVTDPAPSYIQVTRLIIQDKTRQDAPSPALRQGTRYECRCLVGLVTWIYNFK